MPIISVLEVEAGESETEGYLRLYSKLKPDWSIWEFIKKKNSKNELVQVEMYIIDLRLLL